MKTLCQIISVKDCQTICDRTNSTNRVPSSSRDLGKLSEARPAHYVCKIKPFSSYSKLERFSLPIFEAGSRHKWQLTVYPKGNKIENGEGHLSVYLVNADDTTNVPPDWKIKTVFRLFLFNHIHGKYLMAKGTQERCFDCVKKTWGLSQFIPLKTLRTPSEGYLIDDTCVIGAEVFVVINTIRCESLLLELHNIRHVEQSWKIDNISKLNKKTTLYGEEFTTGEYKWNTEFRLASSVSLNLTLSDSPIPPGKQVFVEVGLCITNQIEDTENYSTERIWFSNARKTWGYPKYMQLATFTNRKNGFVLEDACIVNAKVSVLGVVEE